MQPDESETITVQVTLPASFAERLDEAFDGGLSRPERLRLAAMVGLREYDSGLVSEAHVEAIRRALAEEPVRVVVVDAEPES